jgi:hypothetical protein
VDTSFRDDLSIGCATIKDIDGLLMDGAMNGVVSQSTYLLKNHGGGVELKIIFFGNKLPDMTGNG